MHIFATWLKQSLINLPVVPRRYSKFRKFVYPQENMFFCDINVLLGDSIEANNALGKVQRTKGRV